MRCTNKRDLAERTGRERSFLLWGLRHDSASFVPDTFLDWIPTYKATYTGKLIIYQERQQVSRHTYCTDGQCFKAAESHILTTRTKAPPQSESIAIRLYPFYLQILLSVRAATTIPDNDAFRAVSISFRGDPSLPCPSFQLPPSVDNEISARLYKSTSIQSDHQILLYCR